MAKLTPHERWKKHVLERFTAFELSSDFQSLRAEGMTILGRTALFTADEWGHPDWRKKRLLPEYRKWCDKCWEVGGKFGLASWTVTMACLLKGYSPENGNLVIESEWPAIRVVTRNQDSLFIEWLCYEARNLGLYVIQRTGPTETTMLNLELGPPQEPLSAASRPPRDCALHIRVEIPPNFPPEAASQLQKKGALLQQELLRRLGYAVPKRLRSSSLVSKAKQLKADKPRLTVKESLEVIDTTDPGHDISQDPVLLRRSKSRKYQVRRRIIKPYEQKP
jgi:hypothetical protein